MAFPYPHVYTPITIRGVRFKNQLFSNPIGIWTVEPQDSLTDYGNVVYAEIGDCLHIGTVMEATGTASYAARDIE